MTMKAVVRGSEGAGLRVVARPEAGPGEILVQVSIAGICRTDVFAADGAIAVAPGRVLGHELSGSCDELGRVAVVPSLACGRCDAGCASHPERCASARFLGVDEDGAFASYVRVPRACVLPVPDALSDHEAAFVEPLAAALAVLPHLADDVLVMGQGRIATLVARVIEASRGTLPDVCERSDDAPREHACVIETSPALFDRALRAVRPGGTLILKSRPAASVPLDLARAVKREIRLVGARYGSFAEAIGWLLERRVEVGDLFGATLPLERFAEAFDEARRDEALKVFFAPGAG